MSVLQWLSARVRGEDHIEASGTHASGSFARWLGGPIRRYCSHDGNIIYYFPVRVVSRRTLIDFVEALRGQVDQRVVKAALDSWFQEVRRARWQSSADVKRSYGGASIISSERVVFNIRRNNYRLVTAINYRRHVVFVKWIGTHRNYDKIDARTVQHGD